MRIDGSIVLKGFDGNPLYDLPEFTMEMVEGKPQKVQTRDRRMVTIGYVIRAALCPSLPGQGKKDENAADKMDDFLLALKFVDGAEPVEVTEKEHARIMDLVNCVPFNKIAVAQALVIIKHGEVSIPLQPSFKGNGVDHEAHAN